ncbi:hypothetical protein FACS1894167_12250 [Synergistales bacterium]|nr:hypothetical protein FACS1894167_12250 [Synergistales bacterium]
MSLRELLPIEPHCNSIESIYDFALDERRAIIEAEGGIWSEKTRDAAEKAEGCLKRYIEAHAEPLIPFDWSAWREERAKEADERKERGSSFRAFGIK